MFRYSSQKLIELSIILAKYFIEYYKNGFYIYLIDK
jgi:hypothetical protein